MPSSKERVSFSRLADWVEGRLPEEEARAVEKQVALADSSTLADVAWLRKFVKAARAVPREAPPPEVRSAMISRFEGYAEGRRVPGLFRRVVATLTFEGGLRPAMGMRAGDAQGARRQLVYSADAFDIALTVRPRADGKNLDLDGQIFPHDDSELGSFGVQLLRGRTELAVTITDDLGSFAFESVPSGVYEMVLSTERVEVSIPSVDLKA